MTSQRGYSPREWEHFVRKRGAPQKPPARFTFSGETFHVDKWVELYDKFLRALEQHSPELFYQLPDTPPFNSSARTQRFTRILEELKDTLEHRHGALLELPGGDAGSIYCKGSMAVERMFPNICKLLEIFRIPESEMVIYLRDERHEDLCLACFERLEPL